jgi:uncharacterized cysteine cluster protein YcgN (CxxCxxCC family)
MMTARAPKTPPSSAPSRSTAAGTAPTTPSFWRKPLEKLTKTEWEALCDGCGRCCLVKLEEEDSGAIHYTNISCRLYDEQKCGCSDYRHRAKKVSDCVQLTPQQVRSLRWLPPTCAYKLVAEGKDLPWWHPLKSGTPESVRQAGISVHGRIAAREDDVPVEQWPEFIVKWPARVPKAARS